MPPSLRRGRVPEQKAQLEVDSFKIKKEHKSAFISALILKKCFNFSLIQSWQGILCTNFGRGLYLNPTLEVVELKFCAEIFLTFGFDMMASSKAT